jgi:hypothetical protein
MDRAAPQHKLAAHPATIGGRALSVLFRREPGWPTAPLRGPFH